MSSKQRRILTDLLKADLSTLNCPPNVDRVYFEDQHLRHWLLDVRGGCTQIDPALQNSKFNVANVDVTLGFFKALAKAEFLQPSEIRILTFYNAQRQRYIDGINNLEEELGLKKGQLDGVVLDPTKDQVVDVVHTSDSFQGREATCIILDLVVTKYFGENSLGHAGNEKKANVAFTRARDFLFVVGDTTILDTTLLGKKEGRPEFIFESMNDLLGRKAVKRCYSEKMPEDVLAGRFEELSIEENGKKGICAYKVD